MDHQVIKMDNYTVFQQNRKIMNANVRRGSGGLAIAINNLILQEHSVLGIYKNETDGILGIKIQSNVTKFKIGIVGNYLSPDSYHYGQDPEGYFNNLTSIWQDLSDCDLRVGGGDLNARTKQKYQKLMEICQLDLTQTM